MLLYDFKTAIFVLYLQASVISNIFTGLRRMLCGSRTVTLACSLGHYINRMLCTHLSLNRL